MAKKENEEKVKKLELQDGDSEFFDVRGQGDSIVEFDLEDGDGDNAVVRFTLEETIRIRNWLDTVLSEI